MLSSRGPTGNCSARQKHRVAKVQFINSTTPRRSCSCLRRRKKASATEKAPQEKKEVVTQVTEYKPAEGAKQVKHAFCKCDPDDQDVVDGECDSTKGCGKPMYFCGECFKMVKQDKNVEQCLCLFAKNKLKKASEGDYSQM